MQLPYAEPYKIKMIERIHQVTAEQRKVLLAKAKYNLFNLRSSDVFIDLLTDSGTGSMSDEQWAEMMLGDESYAGAASYFKMKKAIKDIFGFDYFLPTHQGRAAENVLFSATIKEGDIIPGNSHFDTTKGHIEFRKAKATDCTCEKAFHTETLDDFKGNVDTDKLETVLKENPGKVPMIIMTLTCNTTGGQPVSMANLKAVRELADKYKVPLFYDSARFAENAYFIKTREEGFADKSIKEIVLQMYGYADGMTMSSKKDAIVNIGGFLAMRDPQLFRDATVFNIMFEGYITYGGMAGRDMNALAQGLKEATEFSYLESRVKQVESLGNQLIEYGIPIQRPIGGHAVFVDAKKFLPNVPKEEFIAQTLALEFYKEGGVRAVEIGTILADRDPETRENRYPDLEFVRLAIPRRTYTANHINYTAAVIKNVFDRRDDIRSGYKILYEAPILRHFTVELAPVNNKSN